MTDGPTLLRIPVTHHTVEEMLGTLGHKLRHKGMICAVFFGQNEDGSLTFVTANASTAEANFLVDQCKQILVGPAPEFIG